jgi:hypothetical protein
VREVSERLRQDARGAEHPAADDDAPDRRMREHHPHQPAQVDAVDVAVIALDLAAIATKREPAPEEVPGHLERLEDLEEAHGGRALAGEVGLREGQLLGARPQVEALEQEDQVGRERQPMEEPAGVEPRGWPRQGDDVQVEEWPEQEGKRRRQGQQVRLARQAPLHLGEADEQHQRQRADERREEPVGDPIPLATGEHGGQPDALQATKEDDAVQELAHLRLAPAPRRAAYQGPGAVPVTPPQEGRRAVRLDPRRRASASPWRTSTRGGSIWYRGPP